MEYTQAGVNPTPHPDLANYKPREDEKEKASNGYLMSVIALMAGMPLPIINLLASIIFFIANRKATYFVRWHCTQALLSQFTIFIINSVGFSWTLRIMFGSLELTNMYVGYVMALLVFNVCEIVVNISAAVRVRKGVYVYWWFWGALTDAVLGKPVNR